MAVSPKNYLAEQLEVFAQYLELQIDHYIESAYTGAGPLEGKIRQSFNSDKLNKFKLGSREHWDAYSESAIMAIEAALIHLLATRYQQAGWINSFRFSIEVTPGNKNRYWDLEYTLDFTLTPEHKPLLNQRASLQQPGTVESIDAYLATIEQGDGEKRERS